MFNAEVLPITASEPITYTWMATDQPTITRRGWSTDTMYYTFVNPGIKEITVIATGNGGSAESTRNITVVPPTVLPTSVTLLGPAQATVHSHHQFTATVLPANATTPLTFEWEATDHAKVTRSGGVSNGISYLWQTPGQKTVRVTVTGGAQKVTTTLLTQVVPHKVYVPLNLRIRP
jgi:hypothetical protein